MRFPRPLATPRSGMLAVAVVLASLVGPTPAVRAQDDAAEAPAPPVAVVVRGHAQVPADVLEIELTVAATADDSRDAEKKFRETVAKVTAALEEPEGARNEGKRSKKKTDKSEKDDDDDKPAKGESKGEKADDKADAEKSETIPVEVSQRELTLGVKGAPAVAIPNAPGMPAPPKIESGSRVACKVVAKISGVGARDPKALARRVAGLIDAAVSQGAEGTDGIAPVVRLRAQDPEKLHALAYKDAVARAKARAASLADLAGLKLGRVLSVREAQAVLFETPDMGSRVAKAADFAALAHDVDPTAPAPLLLSVQDEAELLVEFEAEPAK